MHTLQVGITGGIGSGKSIVCKIFAALGVPVYDADRHAKELMTTDGILIHQIKKEFGDLAYHADGTLNRAYLSNVAFHQPERLATLNALIHPQVQANYDHWRQQHARAPLVVKEAALMFETGSAKALDFLITVYAPEALRVKRVLARDPHRDAEQVQAIMQKQMPEEEKIRKANAMINNDDRTPVLPQVLALFAALLHRSAGQDK